MNTVLVATDYSQTANNALAYAAQLAKLFDAKIQLFHAFQLSEHVLNGLASTATIDLMARENKQRLVALATQTAANYGLQVEAVSKTGTVEEQLVPFIEEYTPDLLVVGMDTDVLAYKWFGNTTTSLIKVLHMPLLVVPNGAKLEQISRILLAYDPKFIKETNEFNLLKEIARRCEAELEVFHVNTPTQLEPAPIDRLETVLEGVDYFYQEVDHEDVRESIEQEVADFEANLLVMVPHQPSFLEALIHGSATRQLVLKSHTPLLVLPNN